MIEDLSAYDQYLLPTRGITIGGGPAGLAGRLETSAADGSASGEVTLTSDQLAVTVGGVSMEGKLALQSQLKRAWLDERRYDLSGSVLELSDVLVREHGRERRDWWARLEFTEAELDQSTTPPTIAAQVTTAMRDSGPVVALIAEKKRFVRLFDGPLTVNDVTGSSRLTSRLGVLDLEDIQVHGGKLEVLGELTVSEDAREGLLFLRLGKLSTAVELAGNERDWKLTYSRSWFERRRAERAERAGNP